MHTVAPMLSKPSLFPSLSLPSLLFFPSCTLLPALISSPFHLGKGPLSTRDKENRGGRKKQQLQGGMRRERRRGETEGRLPYLR